jgi:hypothetical protein
MSLAVVAAGLVLSMACKKAPSNARVRCRIDEGDKSTVMITARWAECTDNNSRDIFCFPVTGAAGEWDCKCTVHSTSRQGSFEKFTVNESTITIATPTERAAFANVNCHWSMDTK